MNKILILLTLILSVASLSIHAAEFRNFTRILGPVALPAGAQHVKEVKNVSKAFIQQEMEKIFSKFNSPDLTAHLSNNFVDKDRLVDTIATTLPRDAQLKLVNISSVQTLSQFKMKNPADGKTYRVSKVAVTARQRLEFNDAATGFNSPEATGEFILNVSQPI